MYHHLVGTCMRPGRSPSYVHAVRKIADTRQDSADRVLTNVLSGEKNMYMMLSSAVSAEQRSQSYVHVDKQIATTRQETADATAIKTILGAGSPTIPVQDLYRIICSICKLQQDLSHRKIYKHKRPCVHIVKQIGATRQEAVRDIMAIKISRSKGSWIIFVPLTVVVRGHIAPETVSQYVSMVQS